MKEKKILFFIRKYILLRPAAFLAARHRRSMERKPARAGRAETLTAYEDKVSDEPLIPEKPQGGKITKQENIAQVLAGIVFFLNPFGTVVFSSHFAAIE